MTWSEAPPSATAPDLVVGPWGSRFRGRHLPCAVGQSGIVPSADKREGDGATPAGMWRIRALYVRRDRLAVCGARSATLDLVWCDDPKDPAYNSAIRSPFAAGHPERLVRADGLYDIVAVTDHNWPSPVPGMGSAIFLHCWRAPRHPTAGCIAFARSDLAWILSRWSPRSRVVVRP